MPALFANITTIYLLYLFYGASFLFLGVSIAAKDMKGSELKLANSLWMLGAFGFLHGAREWLELGPLIEGKNLSLQQVLVVKGASVCLGVLSFLFLLLFGISLIAGVDQKRGRWSGRIIAPLLAVWVLYVWHYGMRGEGGQVDLLTLQQANTGARFTFGFAGGVLAGYGLIACSREVQVLSGPAAQRLRYTGIAFLFYALFAGVCCSSSAVPFLPVPVELLRAVAAFFITYFIVNALNIFDVETRRKIEEQARRLVLAEKLTSLGQLAAGIAHEINNPLANASLGIQTLKNRLGMDAGGRDVSERLDAVERNIDRAAVIAQELLQFSRQRETEFIPLNVNSVVQGALTLLQYKLGTVTVLRDLGLVPDIMGDPGKLQQVFINVLANSVEAMPAGGTISIATAAQGRTVVARISDTGSGIDPENVSRVFDPFFTTKEIGTGTGLGLSICYGIIRQHNGSIEVDSAPGRGTTLTVKLPIREGHEEDTDRR